MGSMRALCCGGSSPLNISACQMCAPARRGCNGSYHRHVPDAAQQVCVASLLVERPGCGRCRPRQWSGTLCAAMRPTVGHWRGGGSHPASALCRAAVESAREPPPHHPTITATAPAPTRTHIITHHDAVCGGPMRPRHRAPTAMPPMPPTTKWAGVPLQRATNATAHMPPRATG